MTGLSGWVQPGHPLLAELRKHAPVSLSARTWLLESARRWAQIEFAKRSKTWDREELHEEMRRLHGRQVAVLTQHMTLTDLDAHGRFKREWVSHVGLLHGESGPDYLKLDNGRGLWDAGMMDIVDIMKLAPEYQIEGWVKTGHPWGGAE